MLLDVSIQQNPTISRLFPHPVPSKALFRRRNRREAHNYGITVILSFTQLRVSTEGYHMLAQKTLNN